MPSASVQMWADIAQFVVGGGLTVAATRLSQVYGPDIGALVWVVPILTYVSIVAQRYLKVPLRDQAQFCFASFGTTIINAFTGVIFGLLILALPANLPLAIIVSLISSLLIGYAYHNT